MKTIHEPFGARRGSAFTRVMASVGLCLVASFAQLGCSGDSPSAESGEVEAGGEDVASVRDEAILAIEPRSTMTTEETECFVDGVIDALGVDSLSSFTDEAESPTGSEISAAGDIMSGCGVRDLSRAVFW